MRKIIFAALLFTNLLAHAQYNAIGMTSRLVNPDGTPVKDTAGRESTFQNMDYGMTCNGSLLEVRTNAAPHFSAATSMLVTNDFKKDEVCAKALDTIFNTGRDYKVLLVVANKGESAGNVVNIKFCGNQVRDADCWTSSISLDDRKR